MVSRDLAPFIGNVKLEADVPWNPHTAVTFTVDRRTDKIYHQAINKPEPLPYHKDDKGKVQQWHIDRDEWHALLDLSAHKAEKAVNKTYNDNSGTWQHAESLGITDEVHEFSIRYAQWSVATEQAICLDNPEAKVAKQQLGRGLPASFSWTTIANKSSKLPIEHIIWSLPNPIAKTGSDLHSTLWASIAGALRSIATARRQDDDQWRPWQQDDKHTERTVRLYQQFFSYLTEAEKSPLKASLAKLKLKSDRWAAILSFPFFRSHGQLDEWAEEASKHCVALEALARQSSREAFEKMIQASLEEGYGWLHKYTKDEQKQSATICSDLVTKNVATS